MRVRVNVRVRRSLRVVRVRVRVRVGVRLRIRIRRIACLAHGGVRVGLSVCVAVMRRGWVRSMGGVRDKERD